MKHQFNYIVLYISFLFALGSCRKFIAIDPPITSLNSENIYENDVTATSVLTAIYANMSNVGYGSRNPFTGERSLSVFGGLSSDELSLFHVRYKCGL